MARLRIHPASVRNIVAFRNDRFGEFLLNIPALRALKETYAQAKLTLVVDPYVKELAALIPFVDECIGWPSGRNSLADRIGFLRLLKARSFDMAVMLNPSKEFNIATYLAGIPIRVGYARKWDFLLTGTVEDRKHLEQRHEIDFNLELVGLVNAATKDRSLELSLTDEFIDIVKDKFNLNDTHGIVAMHPFTSDRIKQWPIENFVRLAGRISEELNFTVLILGGKAEQESSRTYFNIAGRKLVNLAGRTSLQELAALLYRCAVLVSGDSGPVHLAGCVGTPVIALFRNDIPGKTAHRWGPVSKGSRVIESPDLNQITPEDVFLKIKEVLAI